MITLTRIPKTCQQIKLKRNFFSLPQLPSFSSNEEQTYSEKKILPYPQNKLFNLVANVDDYQNFLPFCTHSKVLGYVQRNSDEHQLAKVVKAELGVGFKGLEETYVSRVQYIPYSSVVATASSETPLFKSLRTEYTFKPINDTNTELAITLRYAFANPIYATISGTFFSNVSEMMVKAFEDRAKIVCKS